MALDFIYGVTGIVSGVMWAFVMYGFLTGLMATIWWFIPR